MIADIPTFETSENTSSCWHIPKSVTGFRLKKYGFDASFATNPSGCGTVIMFGVMTAYSQDYSKIQQYFQDLIPHFKSDGIGAILFSIGEIYYYRMEYFEKVGFVEIAEYNNWRHGSNYKQKTLILKIE